MFAPFSHRHQASEERHGLAVDGAKTDDVPMIIYCLSRGQDPAGVRGNQVIEVSQHAIGEDESVH